MSIFMSIAVIYCLYQTIIFIQFVQVGRNLHKTLTTSCACYVQLGKTKHHKPHHFDICNDVAMMVGETKPGIGGEPRLGQKAKPANSRIPKGEGPNLPAWVAFDRQVSIIILRTMAFLMQRMNAHIVRC